MHRHSADDFYFIFLILPYMVPLWLALGVTGGSYQRQSARSERLFQPPIAGPVCAVTIPVWTYLVVRFLLLDAASTLSFLRSVPSHSETQKTLLVTGLVIAGLCWAILRWFKTRWILALDPERQTWRSIDMSKFPCPVRMGSWDAISGIQVVPIATKGGATYFVQIGWGHPSGLYSTLGRFGWRDKADAFAAQMSQDLNLPLLASPTVKLIM